MTHSPLLLFSQAWKTKMVNPDLLFYVWGDPVVTGRGSGAYTVDGSFHLFPRLPEYYLRSSFPKLGTANDSFKDFVHKFSHLWHSTVSQCHAVKRVQGQGQMQTCVCQKPPVCLLPGASSRGCLMPSTSVTSPRAFVTSPTKWGGWPARAFPDLKFFCVYG